MQMALRTAGQLEQRFETRTGKVRQSATTCAPPHPTLTASRLLISFNYATSAKNKEAFHWEAIGAARSCITLRGPTAKWRQLDLIRTNDSLTRSDMHSKVACSRFAPSCEHRHESKSKFQCRRCASDECRQLVRSLCEHACLD